MATVFGENGLIYIGFPNAVPNVNDWEVNIEQEKIEQPRVMVCPASASAKWVTRSGSYFSANGSISTLYDSTDHLPINAALANQSYTLMVYPDCESSSYYWTGDAWLQISHSGTVDDYIPLDIDWESTGQWQWIGG